MVNAFRSVETLSFDDGWVDEKTGFPTGIVNIIPALVPNVKYGGVYKDQLGHIRKFTVERFSEAIVSAQLGYVARFERGKSESVTISHFKLTVEDGSGVPTAEYMFLVNDEGERELHQISGKVVEYKMLHGLYCDNPRQLIDFIFQQWLARGVSRNFVAKWKAFSDRKLREFRSKHSSRWPSDDETVIICRTFLDIDLPAEAFNPNLSFEEVVDLADTFSNRFVRCATYHVNRGKS